MLPIENEQSVFGSLLPNIWNSPINVSCNAVIFSKMSLNLNGNWPKACG